MRDGIVATIQTPFARVGFDSNRSGIGMSGLYIRAMVAIADVRRLCATLPASGANGTRRGVYNDGGVSVRQGLGIQ
jgi:hypothetical protein